ncbi:MAG: response regulator transcription factor [Bacteroidota bacterium]|nr:response regulator transcription factor [Bacteroidota bacterium]
MQDLKICLVDDHSLFREGLHFLLEKLEHVKTIREAENGASCLHLLQTWKPDIVFMDIEMPGINGIETTIQIKAKYPKIEVVGLSMYGDEDYYRAMIDAGASGFILKNSKFDEVKKAITEIATGHHYFSPEILDLVINRLRFPETTELKETKHELSNREQEVLIHICKGFSHQEIGNILNISKRTVDKHRENILIKTQAGNTASLVIYAVKNGIIHI